MILVELSLELYQVALNTVRNTISKKTNTDIVIYWAVCGHNNIDWRSLGGYRQPFYNLMINYGNIPLTAQQNDRSSITIYSLPVCRMCRGWIESEFHLLAITSIHQECKSPYLIWNCIHTGLVHVIWKPWKLCLPSVSNHTKEHYVHTAVWLFSMTQMCWTRWVHDHQTIALYLSSAQKSVCAGERMCGY